MPIANETILEINLTSLEENYHYLKSKVKNDAKFMGVVKAFGYGSDAIEIAKNICCECTWCTMRW